VSVHLINCLARQIGIQRDRMWLQLQDSHVCSVAATAPQSILPATFPAPRSVSAGTLQKQEILVISNAACPQWSRVGLSRFTVKPIIVTIRRGDHIGQ
uniref:Uncharacterized protein n=1 Tax=Neogobius melanostomus TaxID=47308 RepID=A0A8C6TE95_9GOBI